MNEKDVKKGLISYEMKQAISTFLTIIVFFVGFFVGSKFGSEFGAGFILVSVIAILFWYLR